MTKNNTAWLLGCVMTSMPLLLACSDEDTSSPSAAPGGAGGGAAGNPSSGAAGPPAAPAGGSGGMPAAATANVVEVAASAQFTKLLAAVQRAKLDGVLADPAKKFTVFAPTDAAFDALLAALGVTLDSLSEDQLRAILLYHVIDTEVRSTAALELAGRSEKAAALGGKIALSVVGETLTLDGSAKVTMADVPASNGVIHVIDQVILPSITDVATTDTRFSNLAAALTLADTDATAPKLVAALDDDAAATKLTVFAPTNDAFMALIGAIATPTGISKLDDLKPYQLIPVLKYHVAAAGRVLAKEVMAGSLDTLGGKATLETAGGVAIDGAAVIVPDIITSNGVIHAIDQVILPSIADIVTTDAAFMDLAKTVSLPENAAVATALDGGSFTLFAPSNAAFPDAPTAGLTETLLFHAVPNVVYAKAAVAMTNPTSAATALAGKSVSIKAETSPAAVTVRGDAVTATVIATDYLASNGVIHIIDQVLDVP
jgi:transforming growth factor-beta-induced protein